MFAVLQLNKMVEMSVLGNSVEVSLSYAEGMVGAIPVFETKEQAEVFAGDKYEIAKLTITVDV